MIDWLEEVLRAADSGEEQNRLPELLRQRGAVLPVREGMTSHVPVSTAGQPADCFVLPEYGGGKEGTFPAPERARRGERSAINSLYRRMAEAVQSLRAAERTGAAAALREESGAAAGLTVQELDRTVRRDSRRYDGGMSIF